MIATKTDRAAECCMRFLVNASDRLPAPTILSLGTSPKTGFCGLKTAFDRPWCNNYRKRELDGPETIARAGDKIGEAYRGLADNSIIYLDPAGPG